jgi:Holliday junction DNA helicase RuvA
MYSYIKGQLTEILGEDWIVIENNEIGYNVHVPSQVLEYLPSIGEDVKVYTYLYVREDAYVLYGFLTRDDLNVFKLLLGVNGIGPKAALAILSVLSTDDLRFAVLSDDAKTIARAPGVGGKTAQRVIIELKDKLSLEDAFEKKLEHNQNISSKNTATGKKNEAVEALVSLGYSATEALKVLGRIDISEDSTVEDILKEALKSMAFM